MKKALAKCKCFFLELMTGFGPVTSALPRRCATCCATSAICVFCQNKTLVYILYTLRSNFFALRQNLYKSFGLNAKYLIRRSFVIHALMHADKTLAYLLYRVYQLLSNILPKLFSKYILLLVLHNQTVKHIRSNQQLATDFYRLILLAPYGSCSEINSLCEFFIKR